MTTERASIRLWRDTAAHWTAADPVLGDGEPGYETDTGLLKVGDGVTSWTSLDYINVGTGGGGGGGGGGGEVCLERVTLAADQASVHFDLPAGGYDFLTLRSLVRSASGAPDSLHLTVNGDTTTGNYYSKMNYASSGGSTLTAANSRLIAKLTASDNAAGFASTVVTRIPFPFRRGTLRPAFITEFNTPDTATRYSGSSTLEWFTTGDLTDLDLITNSGANFKAGSIFELWGIPTSADTVVRTS